MLTTSEPAEASTNKRVYCVKVAKNSVWIVLRCKMAKGFVWATIGFTHSKSPYMIAADKLHQKCHILVVKSKETENQKTKSNNKFRKKEFPRRKIEPLANTYFSDQGFHSSPNQKNKHHNEIKTHNREEKIWRKMQLKAPLYQLINAKIRVGTTGEGNRPWSTTEFFQSNAVVQVPEAKSSIFLYMRELRVSNYENALTDTLPH